MKKILKILLTLTIFCAIGGFLYKYREDIRSNISPAINKVITGISAVGAPCKNPITYTLGTFDLKFGITQKYFLSALTDAEAIWEKPFGAELFTYSPGGVLKINLVYDERQAATSKLASLGIIVKDNRASYDTLKAKFTELKSNLERAKSNYNSTVQSFNNKQKAYEQEVEYWNARGGAPQNEYEALQRQKSALDSELSQLQGEQRQVNEMVSEINAVVIVLNRLASTLNLSVEQYNTTGSTRGESFEEGVYQRNGINQEIDIYEFSSREKLVRVLAHEFGHALGLDHVTDPKAIMYSLNESNNENLTSADLSALKAKCQVK